MVAVQPFALIPLGIFYTYGSSGHLLLVIPLHLLAFFITCLVCHGELARTRPAARHLTGFYLWMSVGGLLGGTFNAVVAPLVFPGIWEYPLAIVAAGALRPSLAPGRRSLDLLLPILLLVLLVVPVVAQTPFGHFGTAATVLYFALGGMAAYTFRQRPLRLGLGIGAFLAVSLVGGDNETLFQERSFFGVARVEEDETRGLITLIHGTTLHGARLTDPERVLEPITYYNAAGPVGDLFDLAGEPVRVAVVGLGTGTLACWTRPGDTLAFYEIDPAIVRIAHDKRYFEFLAGCAPEARILLGDARLELTKAADAAYDRIVIDAFSSDAIPVHLLTREAVALYLRKLAPDGILVVHISNRNLDLAPIVAALAGDAGLVAVRRNDESTAEGVHSLRRTRSDFIALARTPQALAFLGHRPGWQGLDTAYAGRPWTDDYSDIIGALRWIRGG
jgi:hypothetical protein